MTPTQVYSLLHNIDTALAKYIKSHKKQHTAAIKAIKPGEKKVLPAEVYLQTGKKTDDVYALAMRIKRRLDYTMGQ